MLVIEIYVRRQKRSSASEEFIFLANKGGKTGAWEKFGSLGVLCFVNNPHESWDMLFRAQGNHNLAYKENIFLSKAARKSSCFK